MGDAMTRPTCPTCATCSEADVLLRPGGERDPDLVWCRWLGGTMPAAAQMGCHTPLPPPAPTRAPRTTDD